MSQHCPGLVKLPTDYVRLSGLTLGKLVRNESHRFEQLCGCNEIGTVELWMCYIPQHSAFDQTSSIPSWKACVVRNNLCKLWRTKRPESDVDKVADERSCVICADTGRIYGHRGRGSGWVAVARRECSSLSVCPFSQTLKFLELPRKLISPHFKKHYRYPFWGVSLVEKYLFLS